MLKNDFGPSSEPKASAWVGIQNPSLLRREGFEPCPDAPVVLAAKFGSKLPIGVWRQIGPEGRTLWKKINNHNKTGFLGVSYKTNKKIFTANIRSRDGKRKIYCGSAKTAHEAALLYDIKAKELYGENAVVNFTKKGEE